MTARLMTARLTASRMIAAVALAAAAALAGGCSKQPDPGQQGWAEADFVFVSPDESGRIETLAVREGDSVGAGDPLFTLDDELQRADLTVQQAALTNARQAFERAQTLLKTAAGTQKAYEDAEANLRSAEARLNASRTRLARRKMASPAAGIVHQVYFRPGEMVPAGRAVIALLPPANLKVRFFVNEAVLPKVAIGDTVTVRCDGCDRDIAAKVSFISRTAEFTPPVIYSLDERSKLVFLIEARPSEPAKLRVGQPVSVLLAPEPAK